VRRPRWFPLLLGAALALVLCFLTLPIVAIFVDTGPGELLASLDDPAALDALRLSLWTSALAVAIIVLVGTPAAYLLATRSFPGRAALITLIELPLVLPPAVAGIGLLAALGPNGLFGQALDDAGLRVVLTTASVVLALTFVAAPFYLRQAESAFSALDRSWLDASRTLGAGAVAQGVGDVLPCALVREEREVLEDVAAAAFLGAPVDPARRVEPDLLAAGHAAAVGAQQAGGAAQRGALARARRPRDGQAAAGGDLEGDLEAERPQRRRRLNAQGHGRARRGWRA
jgi:ABC-type tungstate transport system substrate-binding protein